MNPIPEYHGHDVLQMMMNADHGFSTESLVAAIHDHFGENARFTICSGSGMTAAELVAALAAKGKFTGPENDFRFDPSRMCSH